MDREKFEGFIPPVSNYFRMPNEWVNISADITNLSELKVVEYVLRHTWGFQEYDGTLKTISTDEFMHGRKRADGSRMDKGTGLSEPSVKDGLKRAIAHGYLVCEVNDSDPGRIRKSYALKMFSSVQEGEGKILTPQESYPGRAKKLSSQGKKLTPRGQETYYRTEKETKEKHLKKEREKESPTSEQESPTSLQPEAALSPSLSQKSVVDYALFDELCRKKGYAPDFKVPRNEKNNTAIQELRSQSATPEQVEFVFNDIWDDKDIFWIQHRGKPSTVASQFTARVWKMTQPAQKRQTASGLPSYTEDKMLGRYKPFNLTPASQPTEKPKEPALPTGYTRLKMDKPARARTKEARLQAQKEAQ